MAIKIPLYEPQVDAKQGKALDVPDITAPPPSAFGTDLARAQAQTGEIVQQIGQKFSEHAIAKMQEDANAQVFEADTQFRQELQKSLLDSETGVDAQGNERPNGVLVRKLGQAKGATVDFDRQFSDLKKSYVSRFQNEYQQRSISQQLDQTYLSARDSVIRHEVSEDRDNKRNILEGNLTQRVTDAGLITNPKTLMNAIKEGQYAAFSGMKGMGVDDQTIAVASNKFAGDMAKSALMPLLQSNPTAAQGFFNQFKDNLSPDQQTEIQKFILVAQRQYEELIKYQKEQVYDANMRTAMLDMFDGKLTLSESQRRYRADVLKESDYNLLERKMVSPDYELLRRLKFSDAETFNDIRQAQLSQDRSPGEIDRMIAAGNVGKKITNEDAKFLTGINKERPLDPRDQQIESQANSVRDFGQRYFTENFFQRVMKKDEKKKNVEKMVSDFYKQIDKESAPPERVDEIAKEVIGREVKKNHPEISRLEDIPHIIIDINGRVHRLLNPEQKTKLKPRYKIVPLKLETVDEAKKKTEKK